LIRPLVSIWPDAIPFWVAYVWAFMPESRLFGRAARERVADAAQDRGSLWFIGLTQGVALGASFLVAFFSPATAVHHRYAAYSIGIALLLAGALLRRHCFRVLGDQFTGTVRVRTGDAVITRGAYRWVRHPSYSGAMLMFTGIGLALGNWVSVGLLFLSAAVSYSYRVRVEERALLDTIGEPYRAYMERTKRFIPFIL
jgi:protein-S-isoprenylcysteine O-methyltransferase Ste14